jgi:single-strand selective monofunctional uracil DNA glycosylase
MPTPRLRHAVDPVPPLLTAARRLRRQLDSLAFAPPVSHVYNPLAYAWAAHRLYVSRYGGAGKEVLLMGMNPGPFGMAQTGIPFGEVTWVRDWMGIEASVGRPEDEHPKRPVQGFACARKEVSGARLWAWAAAHYGTAEAFFSRFFVYNYCPLAFMEDSGRNRTPDKLPPAERQALFAACDAALVATVAALGVTHVIGVGAFARRRLELALPNFTGTIGQILHPSPASPLANAGWDAQASRDLATWGIHLPAAKRRKV